MTCECGVSVQGTTENDASSKMQSHLHNDHPDRSSEHKKMLHAAQKTVTEAVAVAHTEE